MNAVARCSGALLVALACQDAPKPAGPTPPLQLDVEYAGCAAVRTGPVCELSPVQKERRLRIWVRDVEHARFVVAAGGTPLPVEARDVQGGRQLQVEVPVDARVVTMTAESGSARGHWRLEIDATVACPTVKRALALGRGEGKPKEALALLDEAAATQPPTCLARAAGVRARVHLGQDETPAAISAFRQALRLNRESSRLSRRLSDGFALAYVLTHKIGDVTAARRVLAPLQSEVEGYSEGRARLAYYRSHLSQRSGDLRTALRQVTDAATLAERIGSLSLLVNATEEQANILQILGRNTDARQILRDLIADYGASLGQCQRAGLLSEYAWISMAEGEANERARARDGEIEGILVEALPLIRRHCGNPAQHANILVNLALLAVRSELPNAAQDHLGEARAVHPKPDAFLASWWQDIQARILLRRGDSQGALRLYTTLVRDAPALSDTLWRGHIGRAQVLEKLGRSIEALAEYRAAERILDALRLSIPVNEGRSTFLGDRERGTRRFIDLLLGQGLAAEAFEVVRHARSRLLSALRISESVAELSGTKRAAWEHAIGAHRALRKRLHAEAQGSKCRETMLPADELAACRVAQRQTEARLLESLDGVLATLTYVERLGSSQPPAPGDLYLAYHPARNGWAGFAADAQGVQGELIGSLDLSGSPDSWVAHILEPFRTRIQNARRLVILPYGALRSVDFHRLTWNGAPLVASVPVAYAVDLGSDPHAIARAEPETQVAVVVADPRDDLPGAMRAAQIAKRTLQANGAWEIVELYGSGATLPQVRSALERADGLFQYAGHGVFQGRGGWESALLLADGSRLTVGEILVLRNVPARVVLAACESARTSPDTPLETIGLAQAFAVAGAEAIIATARPVGDALAAEITRALYAQGLARRSATDVAAVLQAAQLEVRRTQPDTDWSAFRALVR